MFATLGNYLYAVFSNYSMVMSEQSRKQPPAPEGSSEEVVAAINSLAEEAGDAERAVLVRLQSEAAKRLAERTKPGDA